MEDHNLPVNGGVGTKSVTKVNYRSVAQTGEEMKRAGAIFNSMIVKGGGHNLGELESTLQQNYSTNLANVVLQFIKDKSLSH